MQVRHGACIPGGEPLLELGSVSARLEGRDSHGIEAQLEGSTFHRDGLLDVSFHRCIVSLRHLAKRTKSSSGGTASSSP